MSSSSNSERKALSQLQTKSNKKTIKKSSSLRFNEIEENIEDSAKKAKLSARNSLDNSLFAVHEDDEHGVDKSQLKSSASSFQIYEDNGSKQKQQKDSDTQTKGVSIEIQCEIEEDSTYDQCELTEEELEIKRNNPDNYMKIIAQKIRVELHDQLEENKEVNFGSFF